jgi:putative transcriptional regulator
MRKTKTGQELIGSMKEALAHARGESRLRQTLVELPPPARRWSRAQIADLRKRTYRASQPQFASLLSVKVSTIRAWEQGLKSPSGAACRLLEIAAADPGAFQRLATPRAKPLPWDA